MKKFAICLLGLGTLMFTSCTNEQNESTNNVELLKSFKIAKNSEGKFSLDFSTTDNVKTDLVKNLASKTNEIYLFDHVDAKGKSYTEAVVLEDNKIKVNFFQNNAKRKSLVIEDKNIVLAKGETESSEFLANYEVTSLNENTFELKFQTNQGVKVAFEYNNEENINEIHLMKGDSKETVYTQTYTKDGDSLKIDFVNYLDQAARGTTSYRPRRPRVVINE